MLKRKPPFDVDAANRGLALEREQWLAEVGRQCAHEFVLADFATATFGSTAYLVCTKCGGYKRLMGWELDR